METVTGVTVRGVRDEDDLDAINAGCRVWFGGRFMRDMFAVDDGSPTAMLVAEVDGAAVGYAHGVGHGISDGHRGMAYVFVRPEHRRRGIGSVLWQRMLELCSPERVPGVMVQADDDDRETLDVLVAHGFALKGLHIESALDLGRVGALSHLATAPRAAGVELRTFAPDTTEDEWHAFKDVYDRLMKDAPDVAEGAETIPYDVLRAALREPWQVTGAWAGDRLVGFTCVAVRSAEDRVLNTWFTGVDPTHRGLGLATALKVAQALELRDAGWRSVVTQNMEGNDAILASNRTLGFVRAMGKRDLTLDY
jgi:GNAT superfamily N-acetyltransferase